MIHDDIQQHADAALVRAVDQRLQIRLAAHIGIQFCPVQGVVAVVGIVREVALGTAAYPAVDLLKGCADPQRINPQPGEIVQLAGQPLQIAAVKGGDLLHAILMATIAVVVSRIAVDEAVGKDKVDGSVVPAKGNIRRRIGLLKQQQAAAFGIGLERNFSSAHRGNLLAIEVTYLATFCKGFTHVHRQRFAVPYRTLAQGGSAGLRFRWSGNRQHQRWRPRAGIYL